MIQKISLRRRIPAGRRRIQPHLGCGRLIRYAGVPPIYSTASSSLQHSTTPSLHFSPPFPARFARAYPVHTEAPGERPVANW